MIRTLLVTLLFTLGPMMLMFLLRRSLLLLKAWLVYRNRQHKNDADIIDVTPLEKKRPSAWFIALAIIVGLFSAAMVWNHLQHPPEATSDYQPARMGEGGKIVSGEKE
ncbi:MAG: hypothetical protein R8M38_10210 [Mariprofundaceae bacterium]